LAYRGVVRAVAVDEVARMLQGCDRRSGTGRRDVAILTVLARLGSRRARWRPCRSTTSTGAPESWWWPARATAVISAATGRRGWGDRRLLSCGRRNGRCRTLFVSSLAPWDGLSPSGIGQVVARGPDVTATWRHRPPDM